MSKVAVLDTNKNVLEPCHPAVARRLLKRGEAAVLKRYPFTIILKKAVPPEEIVTEDYTLSWDPGSRTSGIAITSADGEIIYAAELKHREGIKKSLKGRSGFRRGRRTRNLRYRPARWANRARKVAVLTDAGWTYQRAETPEGADASKKQNTFNRVSWAQLRDERYEWIRIKNKKKAPTPKLTRKERKALHAKGKKGTSKPKMRWRRERREPKRRAKNGWIAPSLMSRVFNLETWTRRLRAIYPIKRLAIENVKFDMQLMEKPDIHGIEYQQGTLWGWEIREYLLELTKRKCAYCGKAGVRLEKEHIVPKSKGGSNSPANLTMACRPCNRKKGNLVGDALLEKCGEAFYKKFEAARKKSKNGLRDAAAVNTIRWKLFETLKATGLPVICGTGGKTAYHRNLAGLPKTHYYDAASVACIPKQPAQLSVQVIEAIGYGRRDNIGKKFAMKAPGFVLPSEKRAASGDFPKHFRKHDIVELTKRDSTKWRGVINCFDKTPKGKPRKVRVDNINAKMKDPQKDSRKSGNTGQLRLIQRRDGYNYGNLAADRRFRPPKTPPATEVRAIRGTQLDFLPN